MFFRPAASESHPENPTYIVEKSDDATILSSACFAFNVHPKEKTIVPLREIETCENKK
jgi:hypothetical protein